MTRAQKQAAIIVAAGVLVAAILGGLGVSSRSKTTGLTGERQQVETIVTALRQRALQLEALDKQLREEEARENQFEAFLPDARGNTTTQLKRKLNEFAHRSYQDTMADPGARPGEAFLYAFTDKADSAAGVVAKGQERYMLSMDLRGSLFQFIRFLNLIETARPVLRVEGFRIATDRGAQLAAVKEGPTVQGLNIQLTVSAFGLLPEAKP